jgi:hypothetical protein
LCVRAPRTTSGPRAGGFGCDMPLVLNYVGFVRGRWYYPAAELFKLGRM